MKKILFSLLMLCTTVSAWSYETVTVTINFSQANPVGLVNCDDAFMAGGQIDETTKRWKNGLRIMYANKGCVITSVEFVMSSGNIDQCESTNGNWKFDSTSDKWVQDGTFAYDENIAFSSTSSCLIEKVTITYHKHVFTKNTESKVATCTEAGMNESWICSDCGHIYYDEKGENEVAKSEDLILPIDPKHHASTLTKTDAVAATCVSTGNVAYWHCKDCNHCFEDETGQKAIVGDIVTTGINPNNHGDKLKEVASKNASVIEDGVLHHWHCQACGNDYADANATKSMSVTIKAKYDADALLVGNTTIDESYLFDGAKVTFDGDKVNLAIGSDNHQYELSETERLKIDFSHTFKFKANQDPENKSNYYATFYTSEGAYKVPSEAKAYAGEVKTGEETDVLKLTSVGNIIHQSEPVILKASTSDITLMPSCNKTAASAPNILEGTDVEKTLGANDYALSLGQNGVGFYLWGGKAIGANKAYLTLDGVALANAFTFMFDDGTTTGIESLTPTLSEGEGVYNLQGIRVNDSYKGIVIRNGKKYYRK